MDVIGFATIDRTRRPKMVPMKDWKVAAHRASEASPFWAMGNPSRVVATAAGAPGILMRIADTAPAKTPET